MASGKILVVDDDRSLIEVLKVRVESAGYEVTATLKEEAAIAATREQVFDLAIIDLQMPRMDGFRLLVELACRKQFSFPKIVLTSSMARTDLVRSRLRGADRVLTKPDTLKELEVALTNAISKI